MSYVYNAQYLGYCKQFSLTPNDPESIKQFSRDKTMKLSDSQKRYLLSLPTIKRDKSLVNKLKSEDYKLKLSKSNVKTLAYALKAQAKVADKDEKKMIGSISSELHRVAKIIGVSAAIIAVIATVIGICIVNPVVGTTIAGAAVKAGKAIATGAKTAGKGIAKVGNLVSKPASAVTVAGGAVSSAHVLGDTAKEIASEISD